VPESVSGCPEFPGAAYSINADLYRNSNITAPLRTAKNHKRLAIDGESFFICFFVDTRKQADKVFVKYCD